MVATERPSSLAMSFIRTGRPARSLAFEFAMHAFRLAFDQDHAVNLNRRHGNARPVGCSLQR